MEMPPLPPEEPLEVNPEEQPPTPVDFAPPMQADVPQIVQVDSFVQQMEPPPPEGMKPAVGVISIPTGSRSFGRGVEIFDISKLDQIPQVTYQPAPNYPFEMKRAGISGSVLVEFIVDTNGDVRNAFAVKSTNPEFEPAAVQAVSKWKFRAGRKGGRAVNSRMQVPIAFNLKD
jgi:protein TonB